MKINDVLRVQSYSGEQWRMFAFIVRYLIHKKIEFYVDEGNIYATKGDAENYPCIVSHMDTVHPIVEDLYPLQIGNRITGFNRVTMQQTGIGGDDKVGIYIALKCLDKLPNIKAVFFRDEETGCDGSSFAQITFFDNCRYVLQCDRQGNKDFVTNASGVELSGDEFQGAVLPIITSYGYSFSRGMMTDVMQLKDDGLSIACANISCGYYRPHSHDEYVDITDVHNCLDMVIDIFTNLTSVYLHEPVSAYKHDEFNRFSLSNDGWYAPKRFDLCTQCGSNDTDEDYYDGEFYCFSCASYFKPVKNDKSNKRENLYSGLQSFGNRKY